MRRAAAVIAVLVGISLASAAQALDVGDVLWGFDGKVVPGRFNPVSILLDNRTNASCDVTLLLHRTDAMGKRAGEEIVEPCFLSPFTARWVQFEVYVREANETWWLNWDGGPKVPLPPTRVGPPACVVLADPESVLSSGGGLKPLPDSLFPPSVAATEALHCVVLDHVPHWEAARRQAFMDWLASGGIVHLAQDRTGSFPVFPDDMAALNGTSEKRRVGAGLVVRHSAPSRQINEASLAAGGFPAPEFAGGPTGELGNAEDVFFNVLRNMTQPDHNWSLIYWLIAAYAVLIVPVNFLLGRKWRDYRRTMVFCLGTVACFGWLFSVVGRRGYGETTTVHTLSCACPLGPGAWEVTQWSDVFVTSGAYYTLTHPCPHNLYSTCAQMETVNGVVRNGREGMFQVDIPLYSSRSFLHRGRFTGPDFKLKVVEWKGSEKLEAFAVEGAIPALFREAEVWAFYRGSFYPAHAVEGHIRLTGGAAQTAEQFFPPDQARNLAYAGRYGRYGSGDEKPDEQFKQMLRPLIARAAGGAGVFRNAIAPAPQTADAVQLFLFAKAPESFNLAKSRLGRETGYVLYHLTFFHPEN